MPGRKTASVAPERTRPRTIGSAERVARPVDAEEPLRTIGLDAVVPDGDERLFRDFMSDLFAAAATMQSLRRSIAKTFGLSVTELAVMVAVDKLGPGPSIRRIADHLHVATPNVTTDVGKLVQAGLLEKRPDERDARAIRVSQTPAGRAIYAKLVPELRSVNDDIFAGLSREQIQSVHDFLKAIRLAGTRTLARPRMLAARGCWMRQKRKLEPSCKRTSDGAFHPRFVRCEVGID